MTADFLWPRVPGPQWGYNAVLGVMGFLCAPGGVWVWLLVQNILLVQDRQAGIRGAQGSVKKCDIPAPQANALPLALHTH